MARRNDLEARKGMLVLAALFALVGAVVIVLASLVDRSPPSAMPVETVRNPLAL